MRVDIGIGKDGAASAETESGTFRADTAQQGGADEDFVGTVAQRHGNGTHGWEVP